MNAQPEIGGPRRREGEEEKRGKRGAEEGEEVRGIRVVQINCNKSTNVMQGVMEVAGDADVIAIQEPWIGKEQQTVDQTKFATTVGHSGYHILHRKTTDTRKARVMWMIRKDRNLLFSCRNDLWDDRDASVLDITIEGGNTVRLVNVYHQASTGSDPGWVLNRFPDHLCKDQETVVMGDFNAHSNLWNPKVSTPVREEVVTDIMAKHKLVIINEYGRITRRGKTSESIIDLALVSEGSEQHSSWEIREEDDVGSDHAVIRLIVAGKRAMCTSPTEARLRYRDADWEETARAAAVEESKGRKDLQKAVEARDWDRAAELVEGCLRRAAEATVPKAKPSLRSKSWFDEEVKEKRRELSREGRWKRNCQTDQGAHEKWAATRNSYFRLIRRKKREMWDKFVGEAKGAEIWQVWKMASTKRTCKTPTLVNPRTGESAHNFAEKELLFANTLFPPERREEGEQNPPDLQEASDHQIAPVTNCEAKKAITSQGQLKAPGEDNLVCRVITKCWEALGEWITKLYTGMLEDGYHPKRWRRAIIAIIPKPNKPKYDTPKAYRPISLLAALGKGLERVVADRLAQHGKQGGLHRDQWGGVKGKSAQECVANMVDIIDRAREGRAKVTILASDIQQAFPSVSANRLYAELTRQGVEPQLKKWVKTFMTERQAKLRFDGEEGEWRDVATGIPQGSPVSPILFNLYISSLLRRMEEEARANGMKVYFPTFIDDVTIVLENRTWREARADQEKLIECMYRWAEEKGMGFEEDKFQWMRMGKKEAGAQRVIELPGGKRIKESREIKILGVWIDAGQKWKKQVATKAAKGRRIAGLISRLGKGGRGMGCENLRTMYQATARQTMEYGAEAWWAGQRGYASTLDKVHEQAMRKIFGHFRTAPGGAILNEARIIPTAIQLDHRNRTRAIRAIAEGRTEMVDKCEEILDGDNAPTHARNRGMLRAVLATRKMVGPLHQVERWKPNESDIEQTLQNVTLVINPSSKEELARQKERKEGPDEVVLYTDGSMMEGRTGAGVWWMRGTEEWQESAALGKKMEVFDAEMFAILLAIRTGIEEAQLQKKKIICIRADNQAALERVMATQQKHGERLAKKIRKEIRLARRKGLQVTLEWTKAHVGTQGNEKADTVAKSATRKNKARHPETFTSTAYCYRENKETSAKAVDEAWRTEPRKGKYYQGTPKLVAKNRIPDDQRAEQVLIGRLRTSHVRVGHYLHRIQKRPTKECQCGYADQTVKHVLLECPMTQNSRRQARHNLRTRNPSLITLLYEEFGMIEALAIWKEFEKERRAYEIVYDEDEEAKRRDDEWGGGTLEEAEENRRERNGEYELAIRGYNE